MTTSHKFPSLVVALAVRAPGAAALMDNQPVVRQPGGVDLRLAALVAHVLWDGNL